MGITPPPLPIIFCFAGQGSQYFGMAADLLESDEVFRHWMQAGDAIVARRHGFSVLAEITRKGQSPASAFDHMEASHPAIFMVQYALAKTLQSRGVRPDQLMGVSLGEFNAQTVAGMLPFETALNAVSDQPALFGKTCPPGGMIAVLASPDLYRQRPVLNAHSELAGINSPDHFILSALAEDLPIIEADLAQAEIAFQRLPVPFAFHSRFVEGAQQAWNEAFGQLRRESAYWPVWSSATCATVGPASGDLHWSVVRRQMNVLKTLEALEARGGGIYVDLSPSSTLAAIFRQALGNHSPSRLVPILSPFGNNIERLNQAVKILQNDKPLPTRSPVSIQ